MCVCYITVVNLHITTTVNVHTLHIYYTLYIKYSVETQHTRRWLRWLTAASSTAGKAFIFTNPTTTRPTLCRHSTSCYMQNNVVMLVWRAVRRRCDVTVACAARARGGYWIRGSGNDELYSTLTPYSHSSSPAYHLSVLGCSAFLPGSYCVQRPSDNENSYI
jgi:hypothetical protein